jgi:hypothetical protein
MRWGDSQEEVYGFGVNYTVPFAHAYRMAKKLNVSHEKAIDEDVYHFARMGLDLYRVHVWDCEISDTLGNLLENEHLRLFDYMLKQMKDRGMHMVLTPIAYWGNGYPEPGEDTPGFSTKYGKEACLTHPEAIKAQETYLYQFLNHVNPYTGVAYKDDPDIIAFEVSNEPHHGGKPEEVTDFINRMVQSMRKTGCSKPVFYNVSHSIHLAEAYFDADIQGGTFQWYPTGLVAQHEVKGNFLPNVDQYTISFDDVIRQNKGAKLVYEFDAADVGRSYIYPAIARSFREAGIQIAAHFSYDPTYLAYANTEYSTHYMNLVYAPQKGLSLKIASEVFHTIPMYKNFGRYPDNTSFDVFNVSYEKDLAEMVAENKFFYTNHTSSTPPAPEKLEELAGFGNSPVVQYDGLGAYFLDRLENGVWRLEVMPDAIWVKDPFGRNSPDKVLSVINWKAWSLTIDLPDLGDNYSIQPLNEGNTLAAKSEGKSFTVAPGSYLLTRAGTTTQLNGESAWKNITLKEFAAPSATVEETHVVHQPMQEVAAGKPLPIEATIVAVEDPEEVQLVVYAGGRPQTMTLEKSSAYQYTATIPGEQVQEGFLRYYIAVREKDQYFTYPSGIKGHPEDWDFYDQTPYQVCVLPETAPVYLFNALTDTDELSRQWRRGSRLMPTGEPAKGEFFINIEKLPVVVAENKEGLQIHDESFRYYFGHKVAGRKEALSSKSKIVFHGKALNDKPCKLQLALVTKDGSAYGGIIIIGTEKRDYALSLNDLKKVKLVTLPRPYPTFLPYFFENGRADNLEMDEVESLQFSIGPGIPDNAWDAPHGMAIESVRLD